MYHSFIYTYQLLEYLLKHESVQSSTQQFAALDRMSRWTVANVTMGS
jgi:hypothetical protein